MGCTVSGPNAVKTQPDNNGNNVIENRPPVKVVTSMSGDVTSLLDARKERQKRAHLKRNKIMSSAEELSDKVMDEKERLSLGTRMTSRTTSRNTSRAPSPVPKKHVHFPDGRCYGAHVKEMPTKLEQEFQSDRLENKVAQPGEQNKMKVISPALTDDAELVKTIGQQLANPVVTISSCSPRDFEHKKIKFDNIPIHVS